MMCLSPDPPGSFMKLLCCLALLVACACPCAAQNTPAEWQAKAAQKYPELAARDSEFNKRFVATYTERRSSKPALFANPQWPMILADEVAAQLAPGSVPPTPPPSQPVAPLAPLKPAPNPQLAEYEADATPSSSGLSAAKFRWWAPDNVKVRGVLLLIPGRDGDGRGMASDEAWRALATQLQFGIVACYLHIAKDDPFTYQGDPKGVVSDLLNKSINAVLAQNGLTLKNPPLAFWGHSAGGNVTQQYMIHHANRVAGAVLMRATAGPGDLAPGKGDVPTLIFVGGKDKPDWVKSALEYYELGHAAHAAWTLALNPKEGHEIGHTQALASAYLAAAVSLRLPTQTYSGEGAKPIKLNKQAGWLGDPDSLEVAVAGQFKGKKRKRSGCRTRQRQRRGRIICG